MKPQPSLPLRSLPATLETSPMVSPQNKNKVSERPSQPSVPTSLLETALFAGEGQRRNWSCQGMSCTGSESAILQEANFVPNDIRAIHTATATCVHSRNVEIQQPGEIVLKVFQHDIQAASSSSVRLSIVVVIFLIACSRNGSVTQDQMCRSISAKTMAKYSWTKKRR